MKKSKKISTAFMTGILCMTLLGGSLLSGCSNIKSSDTAKDSATAKTDTDKAASEETVKGTSEGSSEMTEYAIPFLGVNVFLPNALIDRMEQEELALLSGEEYEKDGTTHQYSYVSWNVIPEGLSSEEAKEQQMEGTADWDCAGVLGFYQVDMEDQLDELTGCDEHQKIGSSNDGAYDYYLSTNSKVDEAITAQIREITVTIKGLEAYEESLEDVPQSEFNGTSLGEFTMEDVNGETYTQDMFKDYELTMVNIFATWCSPCIAEIPDLEKLHQQMKDKGVNIVGVVLDAADEKGNVDETAVEKAKVLAEKTGATYPFLVPDSTYMNGRLTGIQAVPETFFVDKDGNIVGETYSGSASLEDWVETVEKELTNLKGES